jgi:hypothetical protein
MTRLPPAGGILYEISTRPSEYLTSCGKPDANGKIVRIANLENPSEHAYRDWHHGFRLLQRFGEKDATPATVAWSTSLTFSRAAGTTV